ncbi:MAG: EAL domain-containing protein [Betaproteobacteria bacterium]|nr:EAL domain-containing protein [Betaproteobacteria bacterium]
MEARLNGNAEAELNALRDRVAGITSTLPDVVWSVEVPSNEIVYVSPAVEAVFGKTAEQMCGQLSLWSDLIHPEDRERVLADWNHALRGGRIETEYRVITPQGAVRWIETRGQPARDASGAVIRIDGMARDVTKRRTHEEKLAFLAHYDELTGLPNRALFLDHLGGTLRRAREVGTTTAVAIGNLRRLRRVNECFGWSAGDALLRAFAQRVRTQWPDPEQFARISGDTFALMLPNFNDPVAIAATIDKAIESATEFPFIIEGQEFRIALAVGVTVCPPDADDPQILLLNAEAALQRARLSGERMLFYQPDMNACATETLLLENRLRGALEKEEFELHYQPKVEAASGRVSGLEALIRWHDPLQGLIPPAKFIPILEETGLIREVGAWAIRKALTESRDWRMTHGGPLRIAVNVSPVQLKQADFVDTVRRAVEGLGIAVTQLDLEITETMVMDDVAANVRKIQALRDMGMNVAIDDFGTGYSSLAYLAQLPVNALKIDRAFVATMTSDAHSMTLVSTIISLARALGLKVIAEGVETDEQAKMLRLLRCDELQGYLYSKPLKATEVEDFLRR